MDNNEKIIATDGAHIKVMNSYDYGHFEITLGLSGKVTAEMVDDTRKDAQRLVDKAIHQYKQAKKYHEDMGSVGRRIDYIRSQVESFKDVPESEYTPEQKALFQELNDHLYFSGRDYDYQEDWDDYDPDFMF